MLGLYAGVHYSVARRSREIGVRISVGATKQDIIKMILQRTFLMILVAILAGVLLALAFVRLVESFLSDARSSDAITYTAVVCLVTLVSLAACWLPAVRAANIDPVLVLRQE